MKNPPKSVFPVFVFLIFSLVFFVFENPGLAKNDEAADLHFGRLGLVPLDDRSDGALGHDLDRLIRLNIEETIRYKVSLSKIPSQTSPPGPRKIKKLAQKYKQDGIITSFAELEGDRVRLGLFLFSGSSGRVFSRELISFKTSAKPRVVERAVNSLVNKLLSRLPYNGWVLEVGERGRSIKVNSGLFHGLEKGAILDLYSLSTIKRSSLTGEFISSEDEKIGRLKIVEVERFGATARIVNLERGKRISGGEFFRFKPSEKILSSVRDEKLAILRKQQIEETRKKEIGKPQKPAEPPKTVAKTGQPKGSLSLYLGSAWSSYTLESSPLNLTRDTTAFPRLKSGGEYWFRPWFGVGGNFSYGVVKFDKVDSVSVDESARVLSFTMSFNFRLAAFGGDPGSGLVARLGFQNFQYKFSTTDTQFLTDTRYSGPLLGAEIRFPINPRLKTNIGVNYFPSVKVNEKPVSSGEDPSSAGGEAYIDGKFRLAERLWFSMKYEYLGFITDFSGTGDRAGGLTGAETKDLFQSLLFGLSFEF